MDYKNVSSLLKEYNHFIIEEDWKKSTKDHPDFPHLNAFSDIFNQYGIDNYIAEVPFDLIDDLPNVFIGLVNYNDNLETAIIKKNSNEIKLLFFDTSIVIDKKEFLKIWNGYILVIEENENPLNIPKLKKKLNYIPHISFGILILFFLITNYFFDFLNIVSLSLIGVNFIGLFLSYLAIKESFGFGNKHLFRVCSAIKNGNCNQVIKSNNANLFFGITYSDLTFVFYFYSLIISFIISKFPLLITLNIFFIPISFVIILYSIYQQKISIKKWCLLCLGISLTTFFQSILLIYFSNNGLVNLKYGVFSLLIFCSVLLLFFLLKPILSNYSELIFEKYQRGAIYKDKEVFNLYFQKNTLVSENEYPMLSFIKLNEINSNFNMSLVISLNCEYCKSEYKKFRELMFYYENKVNFNVLFNFDTNEIDNNLILVVENLYFRKDNFIMSIKAMDDFFIKNISPIEWLKKWSNGVNLTHNVTYKNIEILNNNSITDTPCVLINNRLYPKEYKIEDIKYFLNSLIS